MTDMFETATEAIELQLKRLPYLACKGQSVVDVTFACQYGCNTLRYVALGLGTLRVCTFGFSHTFRSS